VEDVGSTEPVSVGKPHLAFPWCASFGSTATVVSTSRGTQPPGRSWWESAVGPLRLGEVLAKGAQYGVLVGPTPLIAMNSVCWAEAQVTTISGMAQVVAGIAGVTIGVIPRQVRF
jgi:hypothetical protein